VKEYSIDVLEVLGRALRDEHKVIIPYDVGRCMLLIGILQLTIRHPELPAIHRAHAKILAGDLASEVLVLHPELQDFIADGWDANLDVEVKS